MAKKLVGAAFIILTLLVLAVSGASAAGGADEEEGGRRGLLSTTTNTASARKLLQILQCTTDADCGDPTTRYCYLTQCRTYAQRGEACDPLIGFEGTRCAPGLVCYATAYLEEVYCARG